MNGTLKLASQTLAFADLPPNANPLQKYVDWAVRREISVRNPKSVPYTIDPGATLTAFSGTRSTTIDNTTQIQLTQSLLAATRYRFAWTGSGTAPGFRADRNLNLAGRSVAMTVAGNATLTMGAQAGDFTAVLVGDIVFIPDTTTGDTASPFNPMNTGYWKVLAVAGDGSSVQLARASGGFLGYTETVSVVAAGSVLAFSATGVQVGDGLSVTAGFPASAFGTYGVVAVTSRWIEVVATLPLPVSVTAAPGATGFQLYTSPRRYLRIESDQVVAVQVNGATDTTQRIEPWAPGDLNQTGFYEKCGLVWSTVLVNLTTTPANVLLISAE